jgi:hypothetical protein
MKINNRAAGSDEHFLFHQPALLSPDDVFTDVILRSVTELRTWPSGVSLHFPSPQRGLVVVQSRFPYPSVLTNPSFLVPFILLPFNARDCMMRSPGQLLWLCAFVSAPLCETTPRSVRYTRDFNHC